MASLIPVDSDDNTYRWDEEPMWLWTRVPLAYMCPFCRRQTSAYPRVLQYSPRHQNTVELAKDFRRFPLLGWLAQIACDECDALVMLPVTRAQVNQWGRTLMGWDVGM